MNFTAIIINIPLRTNVYNLYWKTYGKNGLPYSVKFSCKNISEFLFEQTNSQNISAFQKLIIWIKVC